MLTAAHWLQTRRVGGLGTRIFGGEQTRSYTSRGNPRSGSKIRAEEERWLPHSQSVATVRDVLPETDNRPLPRKFTVDGYVAPKKPVLAPSPVKSVKRVSKKSKKTLKRVKARYEDAKTPLGPISASSAVDRFEQERVDLSISRVGGKDSKAYHEAMFNSKKIVEKQKRIKDEFLVEESRRTPVPRYVPEQFTSENTDEALVDDPELKSNWKKRVRAVQKQVLALKRKRVTSKSTRPVRAIKKVKKMKTRSSQAEQRLMEQEVGYDSTYLKEVYPTSLGEDDTPLTFAEGSPEDLATFSLSHEVQEGEDGTKKMVFKPLVLRKHLQLAKKHRLDYETMKPEEYIAHMQKQEERERAQYLKSYDQDSVSRPPIPTTTYQAVLTDELGEATAIVDSMTTWLSLKTRGIRFEGTNGMEWTVRDFLISQNVADAKFNFHEPPYAKPDVESSYVGKVPILDKFKLDFVIPVKYATVNSAEAGAAPMLEEAKVHVQTRHNAQWQSFAIKLELPSGEFVLPDSPSLAPNGLPTTFDEQMKQIQHKLPAKSFVKSCWNCALSEYSPIHKSTFSGLGCFRQWPGITTVRDKMELLRNFNKHLERVQETHLCDSFVRRTKPRIPGFNPDLTPVTAGVTQRAIDLKNSSNPKGSL